MKNLQLNTHGIYNHEEYMTARSLFQPSQRLPQIIAKSVPCLRSFAVPLIIGLCAALLCTAWNMLTGRMAGDFTWPLRGAQLLLQGKDPYNSSLAPLPYLTNDPLFYPLPLVVAFIPFAWLPDPVVGGLVFGIITAVMVWALQRAQKPVWWFLTSPMFAVALLSTNWSPLILACFLVPALLPLSIFKPQFLLPGLFIHRPKDLVRCRSALMIVAVLGLVSFAIMPTWPQGWLQSVSQSHHPSPMLLMPVGPFLLLALLRRSYWGARFFLLYALIPQLTLWYDQLPLLLIARTRRDVLLMNGIGGLVGLTGWLALGYSFWESPLIIPFVGTFVPALIVVLCAPRQVEARAALVSQEVSAAPQL